MNIEQFLLKNIVVHLLGKLSSIFFDYPGPPAHILSLPLSTLPRSLSPFLFFSFASFIAWISPSKIQHITQNSINTQHSRNYYVANILEITVHGYIFQSFSITFECCVCVCVCLLHIHSYSNTPRVYVFCVSKYRLGIHQMLTANMPNIQSTQEKLFTYSHFLFIRSTIPHHFKFFVYFCLALALFGLSSLFLLCGRLRFVAAVVVVDFSISC